MAWHVHVMASHAMPGHIFACHAIFLRVMPCHDHSVPCRVRIFPGKMAPGFFAKISKNIYTSPLPRVYAIFLFAIEYSAKAQHTTTRARAGELLLSLG